MALSFVFFISSIIPGSSSWLIEIYIMASTFLGVIALLGETNFLGVITSLVILFYLDIRYLDILVFVLVSIYIPNIPTYFKSFLSSPRSYSIGIQIAKGANIISIYAKNTFYARVDSITDTSIKTTGVRDSYVVNVCVKGISAINYLEIYMQSS